jgi:hypothetical protein
MKWRWRKLHNMEHYTLDFSINIIRTIKYRRMKIGVACMEMIRNTYKILAGKPEGKGEDGGTKSTDWIHVAQDRNLRPAAINMATNILVP